MRFRHLMMLALFLVFALSLMTGPAAAQSAPSQFWSDVSPSAIPRVGERVIAPTIYRTVVLDQAALGAFLARVPLEGSGQERSIMELPLPAGGFGRFAIVESPIMAPELAARYPEIRTYAGNGLDDRTATVRFDLTPAGFHALILSDGGSIYIDPFQRGDFIHHQSYYKRDFLSSKTLGGCTVLDEDGAAQEIERMMEEGGLPLSGTELRTYRLAVAATAEYTLYHGGTVPEGLAAIVTSMNRVDGVYEREVSIRMVLIPNEDLIIYTNPATDPYTNGNGSAMLGQNQSNLDAVIGTANYDMGHVFSTGGGGIAVLSCVCKVASKAKGVTGTGQPVGDPFDIDYVAHEMGHQFGSNHPFDGTSGSCSGNRVASAAYEPGSGTTIMAYAGICGQDDLQPHSDDYFLWYSIQEIINYTTGGYGNTCPVTTPTGAIPPTVEAGVGGFTIPINTPFSLTASAITTGAPTYCWEESDLGPAGHPNSPSGNAPIFRSFDPDVSPTRYFPKLGDLLNNRHTIGELLPSYARNLSFKITVRDFQAGGVGVDNDGIAFAVAAVGPFLVTSPNTAVVWTTGAEETVTWNVAGTDAAPVNCANVNILLSLDGGFTWPIVLLAGTPNDGSETVTVPDAATVMARVKVEAADNIFFDVSNANFQIEGTSGFGDQASGSGSLILSASRPNPFGTETLISFVMPKSGQAGLSVFNPAGRLVRTLFQGTAGAGSHQASWDGIDAGGRKVDSGVYFYKLNALGETRTGRVMLIR